MDSKKRILSHSPRKGNPKKGGTGPLISEEHAFTVDSTPHLLVSGQTTTTNTPAKSTGSTGGKSANKTSGQLMLMEYQTTTSSVRDFLARVSLLLGSEEDLKILEAHSSLRYAGSYGLKDLAIYSLRMLKGFSPTTMEIPSKPYSERWMSWGMTANGRCLTARTSVFHKTGKGCSLSDILEDNPGSKYFLSEKQTKYIQNQIDKSPTPLTAIITKDG